MTQETNCAGRLLSILQKATTTSNGDRETKTVWAAVFGVDDPEDAMAVCRHLAALDELVDEVQHRIIALQLSRQEIYLKGLDQIRTSISPMLLNQQRSVAINQYITPELLARLEFCDHALHDSKQDEVGVSDDDLKAIAAATQELFQDVLDSVSDPQLRAVLLTALEQVRRAIAMYQIYGARGLREGLQSFIGIAQLDEEKVVKEAEKNSGVIDRIGGLINKLDKVTSMAMKAKKVIDHAKPLFRLLKGGASEGGGTTPELPELPE